ncbi:hypothetical protein CVT26_015700 [Gymnopilus dilepis]|uniref:Uncharacterized protein n=1 Tax=Gymnopilus dilepis TaxID=231916 RepID=A0A409VFH0_9AGAR|nr:hypothetical protein CVT26_015700 [Gymnopilus dilepis]
MASLSDQIDRLSRVTKDIKSTASATAASDLPSLFTHALLDSHISDLIRDIDTSELGLFRLQTPANDEPSLARTEFTPATPLRKQAARREQQKGDLEPEIYAQAARKYVEQYDFIRPMPRARDQILSILKRLEDVRARIKSLSTSLEQVPAPDKAPPTKVRVEEEERRIKDLQSRLEELSKEKECLDKRPSSSTSQKNEIQFTEAQNDASPKLPSSHHEDKFWTSPGGPARALRFSDNLLDEEVSIGDISTGSFGTPQPPSLKPTNLFGIGKSFLPDDDEPTIVHHKPLFGAEPSGNEKVEKEDGKEDLLEEKPAPSPVLDRPPSSPSPPAVPLPPSPKASNSGEITDTPKPGRPRKIRVNIEVERIISKILSTVSDVVAMPPSPSVQEAIEHLERLSAQTPQAESPLTSASSISGEGNQGPTFQQIQTAFLLTTLLSSSPHYSMPLNQVKENLTSKAKTSGVSVAGQGVTRVLFQCVAKRLLKIDRGGREQVVKFDI